MFLSLLLPLLPCLHFLLCLFFISTFSQTSLGSTCVMLEMSNLPLSPLLQLSVLQLAALLGSCSALPQTHSELAPVVVWAQPQTETNDRSDTLPSSDFQSRFGLFVAQSETAETDSEPVSVWPGPAWEKNGSPVAADRSGEVSDGEDLVASESAHAAHAAGYVTRLTERQFSGRGELDFERLPTARGQNRQGEEQERVYREDEAATTQRGSSSGHTGDAGGGADEAEDARLAVLRQRRKKLRLNGASGPSRLSVIRRQRPSANSNAAEKSEDPVTVTASERRDSATNTATEAPRQRRPYGTRRRQSNRRQTQRRRRPVKKAQTTTTTTPRPNRRRSRRPTQPPTTATQTTERHSVTHPTRGSPAQAVYFQPNPEEYPQYPPFAPQEPTQSPQQPLQSPHLQPQGPPLTQQSQQQPSQFANSLQQFSDSVRQLSSGREGSNDQDLAEKVSRLKLKLTSQKEVADNEIRVPSIGKPAAPKFRAEEVTTRPLRELFDVLTRSELAKGSRQENYGPADRERNPEPAQENVAASSLFRAEVQKLQTKRPRLQMTGLPLQVQRPETQTERSSVSHATATHRPRSQPTQRPSSSERVVPSKPVYESGFEPITGLSYFEVPTSPVGSQAGASKSSSPQRPPQPHPGTFVSKERQPTTQSRPKVIPPRTQRPVQHTVVRPVQHTVQRPAQQPLPTPSRERKPVTAGKIRFPGSAEPPKKSPSLDRPTSPSPGGQPHPVFAPGRPGPAPFGARPSNVKPPRDFVHRPGVLGSSLPGGGFPPKSRPAQFPSGPKDSGHPRPAIGQGPPGPQSLGGSHQSPPPHPSVGDSRRPGPGHRPHQALRPLGSHQVGGDSAPSQPVGITGPTPRPPLQKRPHRPPLHQKPNRPPPFNQQIQGSSPQSFRVRPQSPSGRPPFTPPNHPPPGAFSKGRPQGPPFNQLPTGPLSKDRPPFSRPQPGQGPTGQFPLKARPDNRQPPRQVAEESVQHHRPLVPPRGQKPPGPFGHQRPPTSFQHRPPHPGGQSRPLGGQQRPSAVQGKPPIRQRRPPFNVQQGPSATAGSKRPPFGIQGDSTTQKRPPFGFQQRPSGSPDQRKPPPGFQRRPPSGPQQRPPHGFHQGASGPAGLGLRVPPHLRPGARLPASAHPRNPSEGPLSELSRRRTGQESSQLQLQRG